MGGGWGLALITLLLVAVGCWLYVFGAIGWAQFLWVAASGTAGAGVALMVESRLPPGGPHDTDRNRPP